MTSPWRRPARDGFDAQLGGGWWRMVAASVVAVAVAAPSPAGAASVPVGRIVFAWAASGHAHHPVLVGRCVVTPVSSTVVVTAAHCIGVSRQQGVLTVSRPTGLRIVLGYRNVTGFVTGASDRRLYRIVGVSVAPSIEPLDVGQDVAYLTLDRPTSVPPLPIANDAAILAPGTAGESYGWTWVASGRITAATPLRHAFVTVAARTPTITLQNGYYAGPTTLFTRAIRPNGCPVYDGSPLIIQQPAGPAIAAVAAGTFNMCRGTRAPAWGAVFAPLSPSADPAVRVAFPNLHGGVRYLGATNRGGRVRCTIDPRDAANPDYTTTYTWQIHIRSLVEPTRGATRTLHTQTITLPTVPNEYEVGCATSTRSATTGLATTMGGRYRQLPPVAARQRVRSMARVGGQRAEGSS